jgi:hypothetical protein
MTTKLIPFPLVFLILVLNTIPSKGLDKDSLLIKENKPTTAYASETFLSTRIINGHSVETIRKKQLDFRISHRFGQLNEGIDQFYGLDHGTIHLSLEYGIKDWLEIGVGRSTFEKTVDAYLKATIFRQSKGDKNMPFHLSYVASSEWITIKNVDPTRQLSFDSRLSYIQQLLIARKFSDRFSMQLTPTYIHRNTVPTPQEKNDLFSLGGGARYKITKWVAITAEYFWVNRPNASSLSTTYYNPLSVGIDIDTGGGHVFQIILTNSQAMREGGFIGKTTGSWKDGGIHLGFNISRLFSLSKD